MSLIPELIRKLFSQEKHIQILDNAISTKVCYCRGKDLENYSLSLRNYAYTESFI